MLYSLKISAGTKVLSRNGIVTLRDDVEVDCATRDPDGAFRYRVSGCEYIVSAGCCEFREDHGQYEGWMHKNGLIAFV